MAEWLAEAVVAVGNGRIGLHKELNDRFGPKAVVAAWAKIKSDCLARLLHALTSPVCCHLYIGECPPLLSPIRRDFPPLRDIGDSYRGMELSFDDFGDEIGIEEGERQQVVDVFVGHLLGAGDFGDGRGAA